MSDTAETDLYPLKVDNACATMARMLKTNAEFLNGSKELVAPIAVGEDNAIIIRASWVRKPVAK